jgi:hypothetical protein
MTNGNAKRFLTLRCEKSAATAAPCLAAYQQFLRASFAHGNYFKDCAAPRLELSSPTAGLWEPYSGGLFLAAQVQKTLCVFNRQLAAGAANPEQGT